MVAYNSLMDVADMPGAVAEAARVLQPGRPLCICVTHPTADVRAVRPLWGKTFTLLPADQS